MELNLKNKVALITGASKGIGEAAALALASQGVKVAINSRKQEDLDQVANKIKSASGECITLAGNAGDIPSCKAMVEKTVQTFGGLDILVNNAASNPVYGPIDQAEDWAWDKIMGVNVKAPFELSRLAYPLMKARGRGSVINMSSIAGDRPDPGLGIYSVSKAALNMLTKVLAKEWGPDNIRVNAICPGLIKTKFSQALWQDDTTLQKFLKHVPMKRTGSVDEIAALVVFLASDLSGYCTGTLFTADGGTTI